MKALSVIILILSFGTLHETFAADQYAPIPDTLTLIPYVKVIKGASQTVQFYNGKGYNTYKIFYDGLSRPVQKHALAASPAGKDVVVFTKYDCMGRDDSVTYIPYVAKNGNGTLRTNPVMEQALFYMRTMGYLDDGQYAFSRKLYAKTPLEEVTLTDAPGLYHNSQSTLAHPLTHTVRLNQQAGTVGSFLDKVNEYRVANDSVLVYMGPYSRELLLVKQTDLGTTDTERKIMLEYTNQQGQTVAQGELINDSLLRLTHYVYDDLGNQRYVIPAIEQDEITRNPYKRAFTPGELKYSIYHGYDKYGDRIIVRNPDQAPVNYVYDAKHRVILSQDGNQHTKHQWTYSVYDEFNRVLRKSCIYADAAPELVRAWLEEKYGMGANNIIESKFVGKRLLEQYQYTDYDEPVRKSVQISRELVPGMAATVTYTQFQMPDYLAYKVELPYTATARKSDNPGAIYYQKTAVLSADPADTLSYVERAFYYDDKGRLIQTVIRNHLGGTTRITNQYDNVGNVLATHESKQLSAAKLADVRIVKNKYDNFGRLLYQRCQLNNSPWAVVNYKYDELGRCTQTICGDSILTTRYTYDIAGRQTLQDNEVFVMELRYEKPSVTKEAKPRYDGLITECSWVNKKVPGELPQTYAYDFTPYGQLAGCAHYEGTVKRDKYVEQCITYDKNDNLLTLRRFEDTRLISNPRYVYQGNALTLHVDQGKGSTFTYDPNGNVVYDGRKCCNYQYNSLNLLERATDSADNTLAEYSYLADGTKLAVRDKAGNGYTYLGSLIYQSNAGRLKLEGTQFNGGSILKTTAGYEIVYHVTDYLGSVRAVVDSSGKVLEYNNYYPFGGLWPKTGSRFAGNRYRFNGKELQVTGQLGLLDYGARMYDPALGRWLNPDPAMQGANPYAFSGNNPVIYIDKDGRFFLSFLSGFIRGIFQGKNPFRTGWKNVTNTAKIIGGLFVGDFSQILSRLTWELPQTLLGFSFSFVSSEVGLVSNVNHYDGATVINSYLFGHSAFTLGSYITGGSSIQADPTNSLFQHEYGHYLQSQDVGPFYMAAYAVPSVMSSILNHKNHHHYLTEQDANARAIKYWENKFPGFVEDGNWRFDINPIDGYDKDKSFEENLPALNDLYINHSGSPSSYEYKGKNETIY